MPIISKIYNYLSRQAEQGELECRRVMLSLLEEEPDAKLLDLGCGDGEFTLKVAERIRTSKIYGIEIAEESLNKAKAKGIEVYWGDLDERLPFESESFDVVLASHIIEHVCNTDGLIKEIYRVLKGGGYLIAATPNLAAILHIVFLLFGKQPTIAEVSDEALVGTWSPRGQCVKRIGPAHRRLFTLGALKELLEYYSFKVEKSVSSGFLPLPTPPAKVMCFIDKRHATNITIKARKRA